MFVATMIFCLAGQPVAPSTCYYDSAPIWFSDLENCEIGQSNAILNAEQNGYVVLYDECIPVTIFDTSI